MTVQPISYSSDSYKDAITNTINSTMKNTLDIWYNNNLTSYASYLADETFFVMIEALQVVQVIS